MAQEKVIEIKTGAAIKNIADLKNNIKLLKEDLAKLDIGSLAYKETLNELQENQSALNNAMHGTTASMTDVMNAATAANVAFNDQNQLVKAETLTYNELVRELAILKQEWRATSDATQRAALSEKIQSVNNRLKEMDASVGVFGRNVGNYLGSMQQFAQGFGAMGAGARSVIAPVQGVTMGLKTMSATPAVAILGLLANVLTSVVKAMKSNEEGAQGMNEALAPLRVIGDAVTKVFQALGNVIVGLVSGFGKLTAAIFGTNKATEDRIKLARQEKQLAEQTRATTIANAEAERDIAELRAKSSDRLNYTAAERLKFLQEAGDKEKEIAARALEDAKLQYEIIHAKNQLTKSSAEELQKEADAYAAMVKAETEYYNRVRTINSGIIRARRDEARDERAAAKEREDARKAELESYRALLQQEIDLLSEGTEERLAKQKELAKKEYDAAVAAAKDKIKNETTLNRTLLALQKKYHGDVEKAEREHREALLHIRLQGLENTAAQYAAGTRDNLRALKDLRKAELDTMYKQEGEAEADYQARRLDAQWKYYEAVRAFNEKVLDESTESLELAFAQSAHTQEAQLAFEQQMAEARLTQIEKLGREAGETEAQFQIRRADAAREAAEASEALLDYQDEQAILRRKNDIALLEEGSLEYLAKEMELKQFEMDSLHKLEGESEEEFRARQLEAEKAYIDAKKNLWKGALNVYQQAASATSGILSSIADMYENGTDVTEAEAKKAKNMRIAGATIDMLSGVVSAISTAQQLGPIAGPIMAAINSAAVIAAGIANISKIKAQQISKDGGSTSATPVSVNAPAAVPTFNEVRSITGASEEDRLNRMADDKQVYILSSDLEADREATRVQVKETTF